MTADYEAALERAVQFEIALDEIAVTGRDAASFLNNLGTADAVKLDIGKACDVFFCDHRAKALFQTVMIRTELERFLLLDWSGNGDRLLQHLDRYLISEDATLEKIENGEKQFYIAGPQAASVLGLELEDFQSSNGVLRRDWLSVPGYIVPEPPKNELLRGTAETFETLRIEAGTPIYGKDIDANRFVMEVAHAARAVCYTKGCFLGQEPIVMSRDRAGQVSRLFLRLKMLEGGPPAAGTKLTRDGVEVGIITSSCNSPRLQAPLALGYLKRPHVETGIELLAGTQRAVLLGYPPFSRSIF